MQRGMRLRRPVTEYNVSRLGLISIQSRLPAAHRMGWQVVQQDGASRQGIICSTSDPVGVPHGLASDVFSGLLTEAAIRTESGVPSSAEIVTTAAGIARHAHLNLRARHYPLIDQALSALANTKYKVFAQWRDPLTRSSRDATFSILDYLEVQEQQHLFNGEQAQRNYVIRLNREITRSVEGALVLAINPTILESLPSPGARAVYRMLESLRRDPEDVARAAGTLTLDAQSLVESTRLLSPRQNAAHLLRLLAPMFQALQEAGYLRDYTTAGRGWQTQVRFRFADEGALLNTEARRLLLESGVTGQNAESLAIAHTREEIECALWVVDQKKRRDPTIRNPAGLIVKTLKDGTARDMLGLYRERQKPNLLARTPAASPRPPAETPPPASTSQAAESLLATLHTGGKLTAEQRDGLASRVRRGQLTLIQIGRLVTRPLPEVQKTVATWLTQD